MLSLSTQFSSSKTQGWVAKSSNGEGEREVSQDRILFPYNSAFQRTGDALLCHFPGREGDSNEVGVMPSVESTASNMS